MHERLERSTEEHSVAPERIDPNHTGRQLDLTSAPIRRMASPGAQPVPSSTLIVGSADDSAEREADRVADEVVGRIRRSSHRTGEQTRGSENAARRLRRASSPAGERPQSTEPSVDGTRGRIARSSTSSADGSFGAPQHVADHIAATAGHGQPLPESTSTTMGDALGADLSDVRIHDDATAASSAASIGARAFTVRRDVYFGAGQFQPSTESGQHLLAHELTHVLQQSDAVRRVNETPRQQAEKIRTWSDRLQTVGGLPEVDATAIATALAPTGASIRVVEEMGALIGDGWSSAPVIALIRRFEADAAGLTTANWRDLATAHAGLTDRPEAVTAFARVGQGWTPARALALAQLFGADPGGRSAPRWRSIARAHAQFVDHEATVAALARAAWAPADATDFATQALAAGLAGPMLRTVLTNGAVAMSCRSMVAAGWATGELGTFIGTAVQAGVTAASINTFLAVPAMPAATLTMRGSWAPDQLAQLVHGSLDANATAAALQPLFALPNFAARSFALIAGTWTHNQVGRFCGAALAEALPIAGMLATISTANMPPALRQMTTAGWVHDQLGTFTAAARNAGLTDPDLLLLAGRNTFRLGTVAMRTALWTPKQLGEFTAGIRATGLNATNIGALTNTANFGANSRLWVQAGFSAVDVGRICGRARRATFEAVPLTTLLGTAGAAAGAHALRAANGAWTAAELGKTIGYCRTRPGPPTDAETVQLLQRAAVQINGAAILPLWLRRAALGTTCGAPNWADVILRAPTFQANWVGRAAIGANRASRTFNGGRGGGGYQIQIQLSGERVRHVQDGHTFERHNFTYANCTRQGPGGTASFVAVGTNVTARLESLRDSGAIVSVAENAAENRLYGNTALATQGNALGYRFGVLGTGNPFGPANNLIYGTYLSQAYPTAGTNIRGRDLVALGRFFGQIT